MMRLVKRAALALLLAAAPALMPAWAQGSLTQRMAGTWFGTGQPDDKSEMYIDTFNEDGSFHNHHRYCRQGKALDMRQTGRWTLKGDMLTIAIATQDGKPAPHADPYRVLSVDAKAQNYIYLPNNFAYHAHKVAADFAMPPCDLTS